MLTRQTEKGLPGFVDKAGRQWSPEAYVRMDLRTTMGNTARAAQDARCDEWGIQLIEVSSHNGARPKCAPYQGRIFSRDGSRGVTRDLDGNQIEYIPLSETSYGEPDGLFGINCGHQQYPFIPGVSVRSYYPYPEEENAERYQQMQQQRAMERRIRDDKRECMMLQEAGDEEGLKKAAGKLRADRDRYKDFCKETGLGAHNENTQVYGYDRSKSMKTVWAGRTKGSGNVGNAADSTGTMVGRAPSAGVSTMAAPAGKMYNVTPQVLQQQLGGVTGYTQYGLTGGGNGGIMRMAGKPLPPNASQYNVTVDLKSVEAVKQTMIDKLGLTDNMLNLSQIKNADVLKPFADRLIKIKERTGMIFPKIEAIEFVDGKETCLAQFSPFKNTLFISSRWSNSKEAFTDLIRFWAAMQEVSPKFEKHPFAFLAEHETAHIRIPEKYLADEEAYDIFRKRKIRFGNDDYITEYYADAVAIYNTTNINKIDGNILKAIDFLISKGVKI